MNMRPPAGWIIVFVGSCNDVSSAGASDESKEMFAAESTSAVVFKFGGLVHPDLVDKLFTKLLLISLQ